MAVTRAEVARAAGVSPSTVTYVLTGERPTSAATRHRVLQVVEELGYRPNTMASSLASSAVRTVGVFFRLRRKAIDANDLDYVDGVRTRVEEESARVVLPVLQRTDPSAGLRGLVRAQAIDAAVLMDVATDDEREAVLLAERVPTVLIGTSERVAGALSVDADFADMGWRCLSRLAQLGHRRVLALLRDTDRGTIHAHTAQATGLLHAAEKIGMAVVVRIEADSAMAGASLVGPDGLVEGCTAVVANHPVAVVGLACAAQAYGLSIPRDFSVVMLGVSEARIRGNSAFTELGVEREQMGRAAGDLLLRYARGEQVEHATFMPAVVHDRGSIAPPPWPRR